MLRNILDAAGLNPKVCAGLLGIDHNIFHEWTMGQRPIPGFIVLELSSVLGVPPQTITSNKAIPSGSPENAPAVWFKFRQGDKLTDIDREVVVLIRKLGYFIDQLETISQIKAISWKLLFETIQRERDKQASFRDQGKNAARIYRSVCQLGYAMEGLGGVIKGAGDNMRGGLRSLGILVMEGPIQKSQMEGCSFLVGPPGSERPCIFANTYKETWFRRNTVLMHELAHAIFDIDDEAAAVDFKERTGIRGSEEHRADAFAQEALVPKEVLNHIAQTKGLRWEALTARDIATVVAYAEVEAKTVMGAAQEAGFIDATLAATYLQTEIHEELKSLTERALNTKEYFTRKGPDASAMWSPELRTTSVPARALRLPTPYVKKVLELVREEKITQRKAMEFLMIDEDTFRRRFGRMLEEVNA